MRRRRSAGRRAVAGRAAPAKRKPTDWVNTAECYDLTDTGLLLNLDGTLTEVSLPLMDAYGSFFSVGLNSAFSGRAMPWPKRTVLRVVGNIHAFSPDYFTATTEMLVRFQIERLKVEIDTGVIIPPIPDMLTPEYQDVERVYWRADRHLYHNTGWTTPDDFNTFKHVIPVNLRCRMPLGEDEVAALHMAHTYFGGVAHRVLIRPFLRVLVEVG